MCKKNIRGNKAKVYILFYKFLIDTSSVSVILKGGTNLEESAMVPLSIGAMKLTSFP